VKAVIPVTIRPQGRPPLRGEVQNISLGGAFIRCDTRFAIGDSVSLELRFAGLQSEGSLVDIDEIEDDGLIRAEEMAEIRWVGGDTFGVKFVNLSSKTKRFLARLVKYFEALEGEGLELD
jgi:c-di-GMP-binding flagellar brake protein YcgR